MIAMVTKMAIVVVRPMVLVTMMVTDKSLMQLSDKQLCDKPLRGVCRRSLAVAAGARCSLYNTQCSANKRYRVASGSRAAVKIGVGIHESGRMHTPSNHPPTWQPIRLLRAINQYEKQCYNALADPHTPWCIPFTFAYPTLLHTLHPWIPRCIPYTLALPIQDLASPLGSLLLSTVPACIHICIREIILA